MCLCVCVHSTAKTPAGPSCNKTWSDQSAREYGTLVQKDAGQVVGISRTKTNPDFEMNDVVVVLMGVEGGAGGNGKIC